MSLVEKALKKMQEARVTQDAQSPVAQQALGVGQQPRSHQRHEPVPVVDDAVIDALADTARWEGLDAAAPHPSGKLIEVNRSALRAAGLLAPEHQERVIANQYRQIKRPLIANALDRGENRIRNAGLIMVASALPGDGKTFTSINLALSMALEKDITVLLADADVAKPHVSRVFGVEEEPGLLDVLVDRSLDVESLILPTDVPGLSILPAGRHSETATELLASARMEEVIGRIAARYPNRIAVFDSPPLLLTSESRVLATVAGQVVIVVRAGETPQQAVLEAIGHLGEEQQGKYVGLVLNQSEYTTHDGYYGYGSYGAYGGSGSASGRAP